MIASDIALDLLGIQQLGTIGKIIKTCVPFFAGMGIALAVAQALGLAVTMSPPFIAGMIGLTAIRILFAISRT
jgi:hypothetical protein